LILQNAGLYRARRFCLSFSVVEALAEGLEM